MHCAKCGKLAAADDAFCSGCGSPLDRQAPVPSGRATSSDPSTPPQTADGALEARVAALEHRLPNSNIISKKFWSRAFAVLGHDVSAILAIYAVIFAVALVFMLIGAIISGLRK